MTDRKTEYREYLKSDEWSRLRKVARGRANGICEMCGLSPVVDIHHIKYPKQFKEDCLDNLLALCSGCHSKIHGVRVMRLLEKPVPVLSCDYPAPGKGVSVSVYESTAESGKVEVYSVAEIIAALKAEQDSMLYADAVPKVSYYSKSETIESVVSSHFYALDNDEKFEYEGTKWVTEPGLYRLSFKLEMKSPAAKRFTRWTAHELIPKARRGQLVAPRLLTPQEQLKLHYIRLEELEEQKADKRALIELESRMESRKEDRKDPQEIIMAMVGIRELGRDPDELVGNTKITLDQRVGTMLSERNAESGPPKSWRLPNSSIVRPVRTWKRRDIYNCVDELIKTKQIW